MSMAATVKTYLAEMQVDYELVAHRRTYSSRATAEAAHIAEDHIAKSVIVKDAQGLAMVIIPSSNWLRLNTMQEETARSFQLATEEEVIAAFPDCKPGAVPAVGKAYGLETYLDEDLTTLANVYFEAGDHRHLVHVTGETFRTLLSGSRHGHFSHNE